MWEEVCENVILYQHGAENSTEENRNGENQHFNAGSWNGKFVMAEDAQCWDLSNVSSYYNTKTKSLPWPFQCCAAYPS